MKQHSCVNCVFNTENRVCKIIKRLKGTLEPQDFLCNQYMPFGDSVEIVIKRYERALKSITVAGSRALARQMASRALKGEK